MVTIGGDLFSLLLRCACSLGTPGFVRLSQPLVPCFEVVHFNSAGKNVPVFDVGGATLHHKDSFRYLGMVFYRTLNMAKSADHAARPFLASAYRIRKPCRASSNCAVQQEVSLVRNAQSALITLRTVLLLQLSMLL